MNDAGFDATNWNRATRAGRDESHASPKSRGTLFQAFAEQHGRPGEREGDAATAQAGAPLPARTRQIGFLNENGWIDFRVPFFAQVVNGLYDGCYTTGNSLVLHTPQKGATPEEKCADLLDAPLDGLLLKTRTTDPIVPLLRAARLNVVALIDALPDFPSVTSDDQGGGQAIAEHLASRGHRRVLFQQSDVPHTSIARRLSALREGWGTWDLAVDVANVPNSEPGGMSAELIAALMRPADARPTAVVCWNDRNAVSVYTAARQMGLRVPGDLAVVGYDDGISDGGTIVDGRRITSVRAEWGAVARAAVYNLVALLGGESVPQETVLPCRLIPGDTT